MPPTSQNAKQAGLINTIDSTVQLYVAPSLMMHGE